MVRAEAQITRFLVFIDVLVNIPFVLHTYYFARTCIRMHICKHVFKHELMCHDDLYSLFPAMFVYHSFQWPLHFHLSNECVSLHTSYYVSIVWLRFANKLRYHGTIFTYKMPRLQTLYHCSGPVCYHCTNSNHNYYHTPSP